MKLQDLLKKKGSTIFSVKRDDVICKAIDLFNQKRIGSVMVMEDEKLIGILTERDIIKRLYHDKGNVKNVKISELMTASKDIITIDEGKSIEDAMDIMIEHNVRHIPVFKDDKLVGVISIGDVVKALLFVAKKEKEILKDYINSSY